jgi:hypothetical protein
MALAASKQQATHGVIGRGKRWQGKICYGGRQHSLGTFDNKQEAAFAYDRAARERGGGMQKMLEVREHRGSGSAGEASAQAQAALRRCWVYLPASGW